MRKLKKYFFPTLSIIFLIALLLLGFLYFQETQKNLSSGKASPPTDPILSEVSRLMVLPDETPQITTIENLEAAQTRDPAFFKNAKLGDKLLAYKYLLILYDPKAKKIINVQTFTPPPPTPSMPLKISFRYNGNEEERAKNLKAQLEQASPFYIVTEVIKSKAVYKNDVIYLVNPERKQDVISFAQAIGGSQILEGLEPNETTPSADLIVAFRDIP